METIKNNKLIAEFMGYKYYPFAQDTITTSDVHLRFGWKMHGNNMHLKITRQGVMYPYLCRTHKDMKFHSSWDWLMPVIDKIEALDIRKNGYDFPKVKLMGDHVEIFAYSTYRGASFYWKKWYSITGTFHNHTNQCDSKIEACYKAVVEFIEWYNENLQATAKNSTN